MEIPRTQYAKSGRVSIAYQVVGDGPFDLVVAPGFVSNLEVGWQEPLLAGFYRSLASFCRLVIFDKRGTGLSDRVSDIPDLETRMDDVRAVLDTVGSKRAGVLGFSEGASLAALFAATYPERTPALILYGTLLTWEWLHRDVPIWDRAAREREIEEAEARWGTLEYGDAIVRNDAPSMAHDDDFRQRYAARLRLGASPAAAAALMRMSTETDARPLLPSIRVPTLVLHRVGDRSCSVQNGRYAAQRIPDATYVELPGDDHVPWVGDTTSILQNVERFLTGLWKTGAWDEPEPERVVSTVLFTDIVGSTEKLAALGDRAWSQLVREHHAVVRRTLARFRGQELDTAGDGFFASFDGPARAVRCAREIVQAVRVLGIDVRAGLHTGECELVDGKVGGIAVHIGARVAAEAEPGEVLVSRTVKDLVAGSKLEFDDRGTAELKGVPGEWQLFAVVSS
jgi:class 3 adenylate cyclase/pimeloyl-ACP methyl ester carboxylesterase